MSSIQEYKLDLKIKLFDSNSNEAYNYNELIDKDIYVVRKENEIMLRNNQADVEENEIILFQIKKSKNNNSFQIINLNQKNNKIQNNDAIEKLDSKLWLSLNKNVFDNEKNGYYSLCENDIIRFGNLKYLVHEINILSKEKIKDKNIIFCPIPKIDSKDYYESKLCNCYEICFCKCEKKFLHYHCFEKFVNKIVDPKENKNKTVKSYYLDKFCCNKCKCTYPFTFIIGDYDEVYNVLNYKLPKKKNYIILESLGHKNKNNEFKKSVHLIELSDNPIKIGRKNNNDIIIDDSSIKDEHAEIFLDNNKQVILKNLNDNETDILLREKLIINENKIHIKTKNAEIEANLEII